MIIVKDKTIVRPIFFPKNINGCEAEENLHIVSETTNEEWDFTLEDEGKYADYYILRPDFSSMDDGLYTYIINCNSRGMLRIGEAKPNHTEYNSDNRGTIYYGSE